MPGQYLYVYDVDIDQGGIPGCTNPAPGSYLDDYGSDVQVSAPDSCGHYDCPGPEFEVLQGISTDCSVYGTYAQDDMYADCTMTTTHSVEVDYECQ